MLGMLQTQQAKTQKLKETELIEQRLYIFMKLKSSQEQQKVALAYTYTHTHTI